MMEVKLKIGIDQLRFGMKQEDVMSKYGKPDTTFLDDDKNVIFVYNQLQLRLTFYQDEAFRLGYIISSHPSLTIFRAQIIDKAEDEVFELLQKNGITKWERERFDILDNHFNEDNWLILQTEFSRIIKVEIGAIINNKDEFEWCY